MNKYKLFRIWADSVKGCYIQSYSSYSRKIIVGNLVALLKSYDHSKPEIVDLTPKIKNFLIPQHLKNTNEGDYYGLCIELDLLSCVHNVMTMPKDPYDIYPVNERRE